MSRRLVLRRVAELEVNQAIIWYEERRLGLGREFLDDFSSTLRKIRERPSSFPIEYRDFHKALLDRFPYKIYFRVGESEIRLVAVLHASQRVSRLRGRN